MLENELFQIAPMGMRVKLRVYLGWLVANFYQ